jgi:cytochrome P450/NADPH-cytochrome P450 reductase
LKYAVFGLGNSVLYANTYQAFPRQVDEELKKLGCRRIVPLGRGDEVKGAEEGYQKWARTFMIAVEVGTESTEAEGDDAEWAEPTVLDKIKDLEEYTPMKLTARKALFDNGLEGAEQRATMHVELETADGQTLEYTAGDHYSLLPTTSNDDVVEASALLGLKGDEEFEGHVNAASLLKNFIDFHAPPPAELLALIGTEKKLETVIEALREFAAPPSDISAALHALPLKVPRHFSAASAPSVHGNSMHLTISKLYRGRVSTALWNGPTGAVFHGATQTSKFRLPSDSSTPLILIATGTGIAPHRGFLEKHHSENATAPILGIFGYRTPEEHLYVEAFEKDYASPNSEFIAAYSRAGNRKRVGAIVLEQAEKISKLLDDGGAILICGSHEMGRDIQIALAQAIEKAKGLASGEGEAFIAKLKKESRYSADTYQQSH